MRKRDQESLEAFEAEVEKVIEKKHKATLRKIRKSPRVIKEFFDVSVNASLFCYKKPEDMRFCRTDFGFVVSGRNEAYSVYMTFLKHKRNLLISYMSDGFPIEILFHGNVTEGNEGKRINQILNKHYNKH